MLKIFSDFDSDFGSLLTPTQRNWIKMSVPCFLKITRRKTSEKENQLFSKDSKLWKERSEILKVVFKTKKKSLISK